MNRHTNMWLFSVPAGIFGWAEDLLLTETPPDPSFHYFISSSLSPLTWPPSTPPPPAHFVYSSKLSSSSTAPLPHKPPHLVKAPPASLYQCKFSAKFSILLPEPPASPALTDPSGPLVTISSVVTTTLQPEAPHTAGLNWTELSWAELSCVKLYCASLPNITYVQRGRTGWVQYSVTCSATSSLPQQSSYSNCHLPSTRWHAALHPEYGSAPAMASSLLLLWTGLDWTILARKAGLT